MSICEYCHKLGIVSVGNAVDFYDLCLDCYKATCGEIQSTCPNYDNTVLQISKQATSKTSLPVEKSL